MVPDYYFLIAQESWQDSIVYKSMDAQKSVPPPPIYLILLSTQHQFTTDVISYRTLLYLRRRVREGGTSVGESGLWKSGKTQNRE